MLSLQGIGGAVVELLTSRKAEQCQPTPVIEKKQYESGGDN